MKKIKRTLSFAIAIIIVTCSVPNSQIADIDFLNYFSLALAAGDISGTCGSNVTWILSGGTLTISGTGAMNDYNGSSVGDAATKVPWYSYRNRIQRVIISNGVTHIGDYAFCNMSGSLINRSSQLSSVSIAGTVKSIGLAAFFACVYLKNVTLENGIESIGNAAFYACTALNNVTFPSTVKSIGDGAFWNCAAITSMTIPASVNDIGTAFGYLPSVSSFCVDSANKKYKAISGVLYSYDGTELIQYPPAKSDESFVVPETVRIVGKLAFDNALKLKELSFTGNNLTTISDSAFFTCRNLKTITIPRSVNTIGDAAFAYVSSLSDVYYSGSSAQWNSIKIGGQNDGLDKAIIHYNNPSSDSPTLPDDPDVPTNPDTPTEKTETVIGTLEDYVLAVILNGTNDYIAEITIDGKNYPVKGTLPLENVKQLEGKKVKVTLTHGTVTAIETIEDDIIEPPPPKTTKEFVLGKDNNSFWNSCGTKEKESGYYNGFYGKTDHSISDDLIYAKLINLVAHNGEKKKIIDGMKAPLGGECYGIAMTMAMVFHNYQNISDVSSFPASNFYSMKPPFQNSRLCDTITYYQLSQSLKNYGHESKYSVVTVFNLKGLIDEPKNVFDWKSNSNFWEMLINAVEKDKVVLLGYGMKGGSSHAIITCGVTKESENNIVINLYDDNCPYTNTFDRLEIIKKGNSYSAKYLRANTAADTDYLKNMTYMYYLPISNISGLAPYSSSSSQQKKNAPRHQNSQELETMELTVPFFGKYELLFDDNTKLCFDEKTLFEGDAEILEGRIIIKEEKAFVCLTMEKRSIVKMTNATVDEIIVNDDENYFRVKGVDIDSIQIDLKKGISLEGNDYSFSAAIDCNDESVEITDITGNAKSNITITSDKSVKISSDKKIEDARIKKIHEKDVDIVADNVAFSNISIDKDNQIHGDFNNAENTTFKPGDVDGDGELTSGDARLALRASVQLEKYEKGSAQFKAADVDGNGVIESSDARLILRASVKLEDPAKWGK